MKKKNLQILLICGVLLVTACKSKSKEEQQSGYRMEGDTVQITDRFLSEKIKVTEARLELYSKEVITSGVWYVLFLPVMPALLPLLQEELQNRIYKSDNR